MSKLTLKDISDVMKDIDICMMTTMTEKNTHESRPMSNNRKVDYDGDSYFFADGSASAVQDIKTQANVNLAYIRQDSFLKKDLYISISGAARLSQDKAEMQQYWNKDVEIWFKDGIDTPGLTLIHVKAKHIKYWAGQDENEITL